MPYTANTFYEPGRLTTETATSPFGLSAQAGMDPQLLSLLGPAIGMKSQAAQARLAMEQRASNLQAQEAEMRLRQMRRQMRSTGGSAPVMRKTGGRDTNMMAQGGGEHSFVQSVGGAQMTPGLVRSYAGMPGAAYGGYIPAGSAQPKGGFSLQGGPEAPRSAEEFQDINDAATQKLIDTNSQSYGAGSVRQSNAGYYGRKR